jgi:hypothetical protein
MGGTSQACCSLGGDELVERVQAWRDVSSRAIARDVHANRVSSVYPSEPGLVQRLRALIAAESECCAFLGFTIEEGPTETIVELAFPPEARALVERVVPAPAA